jgi:hypothetical protein
VYTVDDENSPHFTGTHVSTKKINSVCFVPHKIQNKLCKLRVGSSPGPDKILAMVFKNLSCNLAFPLSCIFNLFMSSSSIPSVWKLAVNKSIFKKGSSNDPSNYRPISLTYIASKVMESAIKGEIMCHLLEHKLISRQQHGFLSGKSTCTQLLECYTDWSLYAKHSSEVDVIYFDFV